MFEQNRKRKVYEKYNNQCNYVGLNTDSFLIPRIAPI